jgi:hypothetical protein
MGWITIKSTGAMVERLVDGIQSEELYWTSISSAPKDGRTVILGHYAEPDCLVWWAAWDDTTDGNAPVNPTYWMPNF